MCTCGDGENIKIIEIHKDKAIYHVSQHVINQGLEDSWGIGQTKQ